MQNMEAARRDFGPIEDASGSGSPVVGRGLAPLLAILEAGAALEREQATMEAQDILTQADEALVMG